MNRLPETTRGIPKFFRSEGIELSSLIVANRLAKGEVWGAKIVKRNSDWLQALYDGADTAPEIGDCQAAPEDLKALFK